MSAVDNGVYSQYPLFVLFSPAQLAALEVDPAYVPNS
jgi:hypothetical protein